MFYEKLILGLSSYQSISPPNPVISSYIITIYYSDEISELRLAVLAEGGGRELQKAQAGGAHHVRSAQQDWTRKRTTSVPAEQGPSWSQQ